MNDPEVTTEDLANFAIAQAVISAMTDRLKARRDELTAAFARRYEATGEKPSADLRLPGTKETFTSLSPSISSAKPTVTDEGAFRAYAQEKVGPDAVEIKIVVRPATQKALLDAAQVVGDQAIDLDTGEAIPGVTIVPGDKLTSFSFRNLKASTPAILEFLDGHPELLAGLLTPADEAGPAEDAEVVASEVVTDEDAA